MADRLISADVAIDELLKAFAFHSYAGAMAANVIRQIPTIEAYPIEDLRDAYRDGQDNECSYHWGVRGAEPWYMNDEVKE